MPAKQLSAALRKFTKDSDLFTMEHRILPILLDGLKPGKTVPAFVHWEVFNKNYLQTCFAPCPRPTSSRWSTPAAV